VAGGVYDIDLDIFIGNGGMLGNNRDTALFFLVHPVHDTGGDFLIFSINTALLEHTVQKGGLTVVNVRDNRNIS